MRKLALLFISIFLFVCSKAQHTFSIVAIDTLTGEIGTAGATCLTSADCGGCGGAVIITDIVAGKGGMNAQAQICIPNSNLNNGISKIESDRTASQVLSDVLENDLCQAGGTSDRQYGIATIDKSGKVEVAGYTGKTTLPFASHIIGPNYSIQGNILIGPEVLTGMEQGFLNADGTLAEKLMAAMQGANIPGADVRCLSDGVSSRSSFLRLMPVEGENDYRYMNLIVPNTINGLDPIDSLQTLFTERNDLINNINNTSRGEGTFVFPNPASDYISVNGSTFNSDLVEIIFFNNQGVRIGQKQISSNKVDISDFPVGVVYYQVFGQNEWQLHFGKFIIQR